MRHTFVTVAHEIDADLLRLQARSFDWFVPEEMVGEIMVVENPSPGARIAPRQELRALYGAHADKVTFLSAGDLVADMPHATGWFTQQVLKLEVAQAIRAERYTVLDAKNIWIDEPKPGFLAAPDGRAMTRCYGYQKHPIRVRLEATLRYLGLDPTPHVEFFTPTATPFTLYREPVMEVMQEVASREQKRFPQAFIELGLTEFFLYSGWLLKSRRPLDQLYCDGQLQVPVVWQDMGKSILETLSVIDACDTLKPPLFAIHRKAIQNFDDPCREVMGQFLRRRGLFRTTTDAVAFLQTAIKI